MNEPVSKPDFKEFSSEIVLEIVSRMVPEDVITAINFYPEGMQRFPGKIRCFCPVHREKVIRTLTIDILKKTYSCRYARCVAFKGGNLLELYTIATKSSPREAVEYWANRVGITPEALLKKAPEKPKEETPQPEESVEKQSKDVSERSDDSAKTKKRSEADSSEIRYTLDDLLKLGEPVAEEEKETPPPEGFEDFVHADEILHLFPTVEEILFNAEVLQKEVISTVLAGQSETALNYLKDAFAKARAEGNVEVLRMVKQLLDEYFPQEPDLRQSLLALELEKGGANSIPAVLEAVKIQREQGQLDTAVNILKKAFQTAPDDPRILSAIAEVCVARQETSKAVDFYRRLAEVHVESGLLGNALGAYRSALNLDPSNIHLHTSLGEVYLSRGMLSEGMDELMAVGDLLQMENQVTEAEESYLRVLDLDPSNSETLQKLAVLYRREGEREKLETTYLSLGSVYEKQGLIGRSIKIYEGALHIVPESIPLLQRLAKAYADKGNDEEAAKAYGHLLELEPDNSEAKDFLAAVAPQSKRVAPTLETGPSAGQLMREANSLAAKGEIEEAEKAFRQAIEMEPSNVNYRIDYAQLLMDRKAYLQAFNELSQIEGSGDEVRHSKEKLIQAGQMLLKLSEGERGDLSEEQLQYQLVETAIELAQEYQSTGFYGKAIQTLKAIGETYPKDVRVLESLADFHAEAGSIDRLAETAEALADLYRELDQQENIGDAYERLLSVEPGNLFALERLLKWERERESVHGIYQISIAYINSLMTKGLIGRATQLCRSSVREQIEHLTEADTKEEKNNALARTIQLNNRLQELNRDRGDAQQEVEDQVFVSNKLKQLGFAESAVEILQKTIETYGDSADVLTVLAEGYRDLGEKAKSVEHFARLVELIDTGSPLTDKKSSEILENAYRTVLELDPEALWAEENLAKFYQRTGRTREAMDALRHLTEVSEAKKDITREMVARRQIADIEPENIENLKKLKSLLLEKGDDKASEEILKKLLDLVSCCPPELAVVPEECIEILQSLISIDEKNIQYRIQLAETYKSAGQNDKATDLWSDIHQLSLEAGRTDLAERSYREQLSLDPDNVDNIRNLAEFRLSAGESQEALALFIEAAAKNIENKQQTDAVADLQLALKINPWHREALLMFYETATEVQLPAPEVEKWVEQGISLAERAIEQEEVEQALVLLEKIAQLAPDNTEGLAVQAKALEKAGEFPMAVKAWRGLASSSFERELFRDSARYWANILKLQPEDTESICMYVQSLLGAGDVGQGVEKALEFLQQYREKAQWEESIEFIQKTGLQELEDAAVVDALLEHLLAVEENCSTEEIPSDTSDMFARVLSRETDLLAQRDLSEPKTAEKALRVSRYLIERDPNDGQAWLLSARATEAAERSGAVLKAADIFTQEGDHAKVREAIEYLDDLELLSIESQVRLIDIFNFLGEKNRLRRLREQLAKDFTEAGRNEEAVEQASALVKEFPQEVSYRVELFALQKGSEQASEASETAAAISKLWEQKGDISQAISWQRKALYIEDSGEEWPELLAQAFSKESLERRPIEEIAKGVQRLQELFDVSGRNMEKRSVLDSAANTLIDSKHYDLALSFLDMLRKTGVEEISVLERIGDTEILSGDVKQGCADFLEAARIARDSNQIPQAEKLYRKSIVTLGSSEPGETKGIWLSLTKMLFDRNRPETGVQCVREAADFFTQHDLQGMAFELFQQLAEEIQDKGSLYEGLHEYFIEIGEGVKARDYACKAADFYIAEKWPMKAEKLYQQILEQDTADREVAEKLIAMYQKRGMEREGLNTSLKLFNTAQESKLGIDTQEFYLNLASSLEPDSPMVLQEEIEFYLKVVKPGDGEGLEKLNRARCQLARRFFDENNLSGASVLVAEVLNDNPENHEAKALEKNLKQREAAAAPQKAKAEEFTEGEALLKKEQFDEARKIFEAILSTDSADLRAVEGVGKSLVHLNRPDEAFDFYIEKGREFLDKHLLPLAQRCLELARDLKSDDMEPYRLLAEIFVKMGYRDKALNEYREMISIGEKESPEKALEAIDKGLSLEPENTELLEKKASLVKPDQAFELWQRLASIAHDRFDSDKEIGYLTNALKVLPSGLEAKEIIALQFTLVRLQLQQNEDKEAEDILEKALSIARKEEIWESVCDGFQLAFSKELLSRKWKEPERLTLFGEACEKCGRTEDALRAYRELLAKEQQQGDLEQILTACQNILRLAPDDMSVLETAASTAEDSGNLNLIKKYLSDLIEVQKTKGLIARAEQSAKTLHESLLDSLVEVTGGKQSEVAAEAVAAAEEVKLLLCERGQDRQVPQYLSISAEKLLQKGFVEEAESLHREVLSLFPDHVDTLFSLVSIYEKQGKIPEAVKISEKTLVILKTVRNPTDSDLAVLDDTYDRLIELGTEDISVILEYADRCLRNEKEGLAGKHYRRALELVPKKDMETRLRVVKSLAEIDQGGLDVLSEMADLQERLNRPSDAVETRRKMAELMRANEVDQQKQAENLANIVALEPTAQESRALLAELYLSMGEPDKALENFFHLLKEHESVGNFGAAVEVCLKAIPLAPDDVQLQRRLGNLYEKSGEKTKAIEIHQSLAQSLDSSGAKDEYLNILRLDPYNSEALLSLMELVPEDEGEFIGKWLPRLAQMAARHSEEGDLSTAKVLWKKVIEKAPEDTAAISNLIHIYELSGETDEALALIKSLIDVQIYSGRISQAIENIQKVLAQRPDDLKMEILLAGQFEQAGNVREAAEHYIHIGDISKSSQSVDAYEKAVQLAPDNLPAARKLIGALGEQSKTDAVKEKVLEVRHRLLRQLRAEPKTRETLSELREVAEDLLKENPANTVALSALADSWIDEDENRRTSLVLQLARVEATQGNKEKALSALREVERSISISSQNRKALIDILDKLGRTEDALKQRIVLVENLFAEEKQEAAAKQLSSILVQFPDQRDLRIRLFNVLKDLGRQSEARKHALELSKSFKTQGDFNSSARWLEQALLVEHATAEGQGIIDFLQHQEFSRNEHELLMELADVYAASGKHSNAQIALLSVAKDLEALEVFDSAQEVLQHAIDLKKENPEAWEILFNLHERQRNSEKAGEMALNLARYHRRLGERQEAEQWYRNAYAELSSLPVCEELAEMLWSAGARQAAMDELTTSAQGYLAAGEADKAVQLCEKYLAEEPGNTQILGLLSDIYRQSGQRELQVKTMLDSATSWRQKEFLSKSQALYEQVLEIQPDNIDAHEALIAIYSERGQTQETIQKRLALARIFSSMGDPSLWEDIEENYRRILVLDKHNMIAAEGLIDLLHRQIEQAVAEKQVELANEKRESLGKVMAGLAQKLLRQNDLQQAEEILTELKGIAPSNPEIEQIEQEISTRREALLPQNTLVEMLTKAKQEAAKGDKEEALSIYEDILKRESLNISAIMGMGDVLLEIEASEKALALLKSKGKELLNYGLFDPAQVCLEKALQIKPNSPEIKESLARACSGLGSREKAAGLLVEASEIYQKDVPEKAISALKDAAVLSPDDMDIKVRTAGIYVSEGREDDALALYLLVADEYDERKRPDLAASALETALKQAAPKVQQQHLEIQVRLAGLLFDLDRLERASRLVAEAEQKALEEGLWETIQAALELLFESPNVDPSYLTYQRKEHLAQAYQNTGALQKSIEQYSSLAEEMMAKGQLDKALEIYEQIAAMSSDDLAVVESIYNISYQVGDLTKSLETGMTLADAYAKKGLLGKSDTLYQQLMNRERQCKELNEHIYESAARFYLDKGDGAEAVGALLNKAARFEQLGKSDGEEKTYRRILELNQEDARTLTAYQLLARLLEIQGRVDDSITVYKELAQQHRTREDLANFIAVYNHIIRIKPEEESYYSTLTKTYLHGRLLSEGVLFYETHLKELEKEKQWDAALISLAQLFQLRPEAIDYQHREIRILHLAGETERAGQKTLEYAGAQSESGEYERAIDTLEHLLQLQPGNSDAEKFISTIRQQLNSQTRENDRQDLLAQASQKQSRGDIDGAIQSLEKCRQYGLSDSGLVENLARLYAEKALAGSPENGEKAIELYYQLAEQASNNRDYEGACNYYRRATAIEPERPGLLNSLARAYSDAGNTQRASDTYAKLAEVYKAQNQPEALEDAYRKILVCEPENLVVRGKLGELLAQQNSGDEAIEQFWIQTQEYEKREVYNKAIGSLRKILELRPEHIPAKRRLSQLYLSKGDARASLDLQKEIVRLFLQSGKSEEAINEYMSALDVDPDNTGIREELADLYGHLGRPEEGLRERLALLEIYQEREVVGQVIQVCETILKDNPSMKEISEQLVQSLLESGQITKAMDELLRMGILLEKEEPEYCTGIFEQILNLDSENLRAHQGLIRVYRRQRKKHNTFKHLVAAGDILNKNGEHHRAAQAYWQALQMETRNDTVYAKLAQCQDVLGEREHAWQTLESRADVLASSGREKEAVKEYLRLADLYLMQ